MPVVSFHQVQQDKYEVQTVRLISCGAVPAAQIACSRFSLGLVRLSTMGVLRIDLIPVGQGIQVGCRLLIKVDDLEGLKEQNK